MESTQNNGASLARVQPITTVAATVDPRSACAPSSLAQIQRLAEVVAASGLYGVRSVDDAMVRMVTGMELGLSCMQSLRGVYVINGKPSLDASLMMGVCLSRRDVCDYFVLIESSKTKAVYEAKRHGAPQPVRMEWTIEQARAAKLTGKGTWEAFPENMLRARCSSNLARAVFPDLVNGLYDPDELEPATTQQSVVASVVETKVVAPKAAAPEGDSLAGEFRRRIELAESSTDWATIANDIKGAAGRLSETDTAELRKLYQASKAAWSKRIAEQPEPTAEAVADREPGSEG